ncbi:hypothetical protein GE061_014385 [Apolygus lucorum]|uniref:Uncharacterized protein n=1 Tax=Apolygus lucorum TaxID=248454 RepID=A0A8S9XSQ9_APOLU|nr:hypothetical protein GE061_014385 [Apolygus lucorum]
MDDVFARKSPSCYGLLGSSVYAILLNNVFHFAAQGKVVNFGPLKRHIPHSQATRNQLEPVISEISRT